ncbi:MAG: hypothetical protein HC909_00325 [Blastochloris sp.]|nr:hypothetical protein [Blastochloris sp.]
MRPIEAVLRRPEVGDDPQRRIRLRIGGNLAAVVGVEDLVGGELDRVVHQLARRDGDGVAIALVAITLPTVAAAVPDRETPLGVFVVTKAGEQRADGARRDGVVELLARGAQMTGREEVGEEVVGEGVHRVGQLERLAFALGVGDVTGRTRLEQRGAVTGLIGPSCVDAEVIPVGRREVQVAPRRDQR